MERMGTPRETWAIGMLVDGPLREAYRLVRRGSLLGRLRVLSTGFRGDELESFVSPSPRAGLGDPSTSRSRRPRGRLGQ
jgi:hypothetical protein